MTRSRRRVQRALAPAVFGALIVAATAPSWRLLLPGEPSAEEQLLQSRCGGVRQPQAGSVGPPAASGPAR